MKLYKFVVLICVLIFLAGIATYIIFDSGMIDEIGQEVTNTTTVNQVVIK